MNNFWNFWLFKNKQEKKYIKELKSYIRNISTKYNPTDIKSIYIGGSFSRRDLAKNSDIDTYVILNENRSLKKNLKIAKENQNNLISEHIYSFNELKHEKLFLDDKFNRTVPPRYVVRNLKDYKLVKGLKIQLENDVDENEYLKKEIFVVEMLKNKNKIDTNTLRVICKNVFYITYFRSNFKFKFHRSKILKKLPEDHILYLCNRVRLNPGFYLKSKNKIFDEIEKYIKSKKV